MRIGYTKLGRAVGLRPSSFGAVGGDNEPLALLRALATRNPEHTFVICGRRTPVADDLELPPNVEIPNRPGVPEVMALQRREPEVMDLWRRTTEELAATIEGCDRMIVWLGQHGGVSTTRIPKVDGTGYAVPMTSFMNYVAPIVVGLNRWQDADPTRDAVWLDPDVRNWLKARDLKWPPREPILSQRNSERKQRHFRYGDARTPDELKFASADLDPKVDGLWLGLHRYRYSGLEAVGVPRFPEQAPFEERDRFSLLYNGGLGSVKVPRWKSLRQWAIPANPDRIVGKWSPAEAQKLKHEVEDPIKPSEVATVLGRTRTTFVEPALGFGRPTAKWLEAAALGAIAFCHSGYDDQGHLIPTRDQLDAGHVEDSDLAHLFTWLRPADPDELKERIDAVSSSRETYEWLAAQQRRYFDRIKEREQCVHLIESRLGLEDMTDELQAPSWCKV